MKQAAGPSGLARAQHLPLPPRALGATGRPSLPRPQGSEPLLARAPGAAAAQGDPKKPARALGAGAGQSLAPQNAGDSQGNGVPRGTAREFKPCNAVQQTSRWWGVWAQSCSFCSPGVLGGVLLTQTRAPAKKAHQGAHASAAEAVWGGRILPLPPSDAAGRQVSNAVNRPWRT